MADGGCCSNEVRTSRVAAKIIGLVPQQLEANIGIIVSKGLDGEEVGRLGFQFNGDRRTE